MTDQLSPTDLRDALRAGPGSDFRPVDVPTVIQAARRRRYVRRSAAGVTVLALVVSVAVAASLTGDTGKRSTAPPAHESSPTTLSPGERHAALVTWAGCLRAADIPGVTVSGPAPGSEDVTYVDEQGRPLPKNFRETNGEWGSASEMCAEKVPALLPELESQWGNLRAERTRLATELAEYEQCLAGHGLPRLASPAQGEKVGCIWSPWDVEAEMILQCPSGEEQSGLRAIRDRGPWVSSPEAASQIWLTRQADPEEFARVVRQPGDDKVSRMHVLSRDGDPTAVIYLLRNLYKGWRLHGVTFCQ